jgi:hypothetical protein
MWWHFRICGCVLFCALVLKKATSTTLNCSRIESGGIVMLKVQSSFSRLKDFLFFRS